MKQRYNERNVGVALILLIVITLVLVISTTYIQRDHKQESDAKVTEELIENKTDSVLEVETDTGEKHKEPSTATPVSTEPAPIVKFEAEAGQLNGTVLAVTGPDFSGEGYVTDFTDEQDHLIVPVQAEQEQMYQLIIGYRAPGGYKEAELYVNEEPFGKIIFEESSTFVETKVTRIILKQGENLIRINRGWGYFDIDYVALQALNKADYAVTPVTEQLSNTKATAEAVALMEFMNEKAGDYILSGQQSFKHIIDIENMTGKRPAIVAFDFIEYSPTRASYGSRSSEIESAIAWHKMGGIVSFLWHWNAPTGLIDEPGKEWWRGFYTDSVTFNLADALADKSSEEYALLLSDMDVIANKIKILQINDIPVLFRPLHEAEGGWFWWGASGPEAAKELYRIMYDRFVNVHKLNNLIWVWNSVEPDWYPGDDVVDIVSYDSYPVPGDHSAIVSYYDKLVELTGGKKYIAMMENGSIPDPDAMEQYAANWGLFITWNDSFIMDGQHNSKDFIHKVYNHPRVLTLQDLPTYKEKQ